MMDQSYSESDVSISPSQILDRLQVLRQLQVLQRGKLQKHLQYESSPEITSSITEIVSHFSNSTSYNTFRSLLQSSQEANEVSSLSNTSNLFKKENFQNVIEGVSVLNLSEESEFIANSVSPRSTSSARLNLDDEKSHNLIEQNLSKKGISLDEMPILSPKKDFETLIKEKLKDDKTKEVHVPKTKKNIKKPFLKRGEGMARFGLQKNDLVIQNTKSLPWKKKKNYKAIGNKVVPKIRVDNPGDNKLVNTNNIPIQLDNDNISKDSPKIYSPQGTHKSDVKTNSLSDSKDSSKIEKIEHTSKVSDNTLSKTNLESIVITLPTGKHPLHKNKGKTWASVFTKEQDDFLRQLKQSEYYKNFVSPAKSGISDTSCNENMSKLQQEREIAEQNLFELIENKVTHESFSIDNSFFNRFLKKNNLECSGESTPLVMQKCLYKNPNLMHILPDVGTRKRNENSCSDAGTYTSECSECSEDCSTVSSCCSCHTITQVNISANCMNEDQNKEKVVTEKNQSKITKKDREKEKSHIDTMTSENEAINSNMAEMNTKLIATSELLKDRLRELEDEIETFRKENANLTKMREEVDMERQKLFEEKSTFEQKFNEEKILSEYYLAEEKEKLNKQNQMYERYVRDMRGRLSKKEKDEVINLKKEIHDLKDEIRIKDAKSTSTIARLRNQLKIIEKDKKNLEDEVEKLKKENRRMQHSNEITRRLTNLKYLEQINKKLSNMSSKDSRPDVGSESNIKYKAYEIERQSRITKKNSDEKCTMKQRAKSVPNLHVTSRYAKYFSQKDSLSDREKNKTLNDENDYADPYTASNNLSNSPDKIQFNNSERLDSDSEEENNLEKLYNERFKSISPEVSPNKSAQIEHSSDRLPEATNEYFIQNLSKNSSQKSLHKYSKSELQPTTVDLRSRTSKSPSTSISNTSSHASKSPTNFFTENRDYGSDNYNESSHRNKSPVSILSNRSSSSFKSGTVINKEIYSKSITPSPDQILSKTSLSKTNLNPTEIRKPDGTRELKFPNGNVKIMSADGKYSKFIYYNGDIKENFYNEGRIKYYYAETKTFHTTHPDGLEILEFPDGQVEKRYKDGSSEIRLPNGSIRYYDPKNEHVREEWRFPDGAALTVSSNGEQRIVFANGQVEVHAKDHKRREFPDGSVKLVYNDGTAETRYASGRVRIKDKHGNLIMDSAPG